MSFCVPRTDWNTHQKVPMPVHEDVAAELLDFFMNNRAALGSLPNDHPFARKIRFARQSLWKEPEVAESPEAPVAAPDATLPGALRPSWQDRAIVMRAEGKSWEQIVTETGQPKSTVRRVVNAELATRRG
jgi:hypothetical protein